MAIPVSRGIIFWSKNKERWVFLCPNRHVHPVTGKRIAVAIRYTSTSWEDVVGAFEVHRKDWHEGGVTTWCC